MAGVRIGLVGDLLVNREDPASAFAHVHPALHEVDVLFGNLEGPYTDDPRPAPGALDGCSAPAHNLDVFSQVGFDVLSLANNHILDVGYEAMLETRTRLRAQGVQTCGAGESAAAARAPAIVEADGVRIGVLAYASVFPIGWEARSDGPGIAGLRTHESWRNPYPRLYMPGTLPIATTTPDAADLDQLAKDIAAARGKVDVLIVSFHWGDYLRPFHLTDHEKATARYCIDKGADMIVGHHHHALRGMEWWRGKPILYGLGHFVFDLRLKWSAQEFSRLLQEVDPEGSLISNPYATAPREGWPLLPLHEDTRMTLLAWARADRKGVAQIGFLPCRLRPDGSVHPVLLEAPEGEEVIAYIDEANRSQGLNSRLERSRSETIGGYATIEVVPA
jgi:poly-gamma-glutamate synthesis protein (capsule biosynthesis protein)